MHQPRRAARRAARAQARTQERTHARKRAHTKAGAAHYFAAEPAAGGLSCDGRFSRRHSESHFRVAIPSRLSESQVTSLRILLLSG